MNKIVTLLGQEMARMQQVNEDLRKKNKQLERQLSLARYKERGIPHTILTPFKSQK